jgi:hypothetical protein
MGPMPLQRLTPSDADARIPFVASAVADAVAATARLDAELAAYRAERGRPLPSQIVLNERKAAIDDLRRFLAECQADVASAGGSPLDPSRGFVDFPATIGGSDEVVLCWRLGEAHVDHCHLTAEDHAARRALPMALATS